MEAIVKTIERKKNFLTDEAGLEVAEYAVAAALVVAIAVVVYAIIGDSILDSNNGTAADVTNATWTPPS
jgi:Flp pilus assembly pilin Flp